MEPSDDFVAGMEPEGDRYWILYCRDGKRQELGRLGGVLRHHTALEPFVTHLRLSGETTGEVMLIDDLTDRIVARRRVVARVRPTWYRIDRARFDRMRPAPGDPSAPMIEPVESVGVE